MQLQKTDECLVSNTCLTNSLVYKAEVSTDNDDAKVCIGVTANTFKESFRNHTKSIKNEHHGNETETNLHIKLQELNVYVLEIHLLFKKLLVIVTNITDQPCQCDDPSLFPLGTLI